MPAICPIAVPGLLLPSRLIVLVEEVWRSGDRVGLEVVEVVQVVQVMQAWSRRGLETWRYGGRGGMKARSGGLEGV